MATNIDWPLSLPQVLSADGYEEVEPELRLRTNMDAGPAKVRRRFTAGVRPVKTQLRFSLNQKDDFKTFYNDTLAGGSLSFNWVLPGTETAAEYRFVSPPSYTPLGGANWIVNLDMEILP